MYPSDLNPVSDPNPENINTDNDKTFNLDDAELNPSQKPKPEDQLEPTNISSPTTVSTKSKKSKSKVPPISIQTRAAKLKETLKVGVSLQINVFSEGSEQS